MRTEKINFPDGQAFCVFPAERSDLAQAISELHLNENYPVIVLIGGEIDRQEAEATRRAIQTISRIAEELNALIVCGGTDMGVMAKIGQMRAQNHYKFPLIGITLEEMATWPEGPRSTKFMWWGKQRWQLEPHYSHFILVPGSDFGDESPWIVDAATILSKGRQSVTILINGGEVSRKDIKLSLKHGRPVIALSSTGRLADELSRQFVRNDLITIVPAISDQQIVEAIKEALSDNEKRASTKLLTSAMQSNGIAQRKV
jgi:hypothetical protein